MIYPTRESWLNAALALVSARIEGCAGVKVPPSVRVSVGFPGGRGKTNKAIGQCWPAEMSSDGSSQMFISPVLDDPSRVMDVLMHEAIHAAVGCKAGHKGPFKRAAVACGLTGMMTATVAGDALKPTLKAWVEQLGPYHQRRATARDTRAVAVRSWHMTLYFRIFLALLIGVALVLWMVL